MSTTSADRYSNTLIFLHWFTLLLLIGVYGCIEARSLFEKGSDMRELMKALHYMLGLTVLLTTMFRLVVRMKSPSPPIVPPPSRVMSWVASIVHILLYALMIAMPIVGWLTLSAAGKAVPFYGLELPSLVAESEVLADKLKDLHKTVGNYSYYLIALHALAGLYHHYVWHDNALLRMLPKRLDG